MTIVATFHVKPHYPDEIYFLFGANQLLQYVIWKMFVVYIALCFSEASRYLVEVLTPISHDQRAECIDRLIEAVQKQNCK